MSVNSIGTRSLMMALAFSIFAGCGSGDSDAPQKCERLLDTYCAKQVECLPGSKKEECVSTLGQVLQCQEAKDVGDSYDKCISDIEALSCSASGSLPDSCKGVIKK